ncbi:unnamed protein product [Amoebophrya sp. A25]|nr:unnamed protein product [Amoebophrya sp. A25]|eukprot:GSA25T00019823001.1
MSKFFKLSVAGFAGLGVARETTYLRNGNKNKGQDKEKAKKMLNCATMFDKFDSNNSPYHLAAAVGASKRRMDNTVLAYNAVCGSGSGLSQEVYLFKNDKGKKSKLEDWKQNTYGHIDVEKPSKESYKVPMEEVEKGEYDATKNSFYQCCKSGCVGGSSSSSCR